MEFFVTILERLLPFIRFFWSMYYGTILCYFLNNEHSINTEEHVMTPQICIHCSLSSMIMAYYGKPSNVVTVLLMLWYCLHECSQQTLAVRASKSGSAAMSQT